MTDLADELELERVITDDSYIIRGKGGTLLDDYPDWMDEVANVQHSSGTELENINQTAYLIDHDYGGDEVVFADGYARIFEALIGNYDVRLEHAAAA